MRTTSSPLLSRTPAALALALVAACGAAPTPIVVTPMNAAENAVFENGIDYIEDPSILEGSWSESWEQEIDLRCRTADVVAFVRVVTLRTDSNLERRQTQRLFAHVDSLRFGTLPNDDDLELIARETDPGFPTVQAERILNQRFVLFGRWTQDDADAPIVMRWHLSPASERIVRRVNSLIERRRPAEAERRRVIVHDQSGN